MSSHVTEWLNAYLDGELKNGRLHQVEAHLAECSECQAELDALQNLSALLHQAPAPQFMSSERLAAQVNLRLPHERLKPSDPKVQELGWWMIPVSLMFLWVFLNTFTLVRGVLATANGFGLLQSTPSWLTVAPSNANSWSATLGEFGLLHGTGLRWAEATETFTKNNAPQIIWQISIALVYLSWIAIWWARHTQREHGQLLTS